MAIFKSIRRYTLALLIGLAIQSPSAHAALIVYDDRALFESMLGVSITDDYSASEYLTGSVTTNFNFATHTSEYMNSILGETEYVPTGFVFPVPLNIITGRQDNPAYCAGCNGSFLLSFTSTSVGTERGIFGMGLDITFNNDRFPFDAFVTFGDDSTLNIDLGTGPRFFGLTDHRQIRSVHFGLAGGGSTTIGQFVIDDLTIGLPSPGSIGLFGLAVLALAGTRLPRAKC